MRELVRAEEDRGKVGSFESYLEKRSRKNIEKKGYVKEARSFKLIVLCWLMLRGSLTPSRLPYFKYLIVILIVACTL